MAVDFIGGSTAASQLSDLRAQSLGQEEFLNILLTQLKFQDPLKPLDNQEFLAQMAQFSSLAQTQQMNDRIDALLSIQSADQSIGLIGKTVEVQTGSGAKVGTVGSLRFVDGVPNLTVTTAANEVLTSVSLSQITLVR